MSELIYCEPDKAAEIIGNRRSDSRLNQKLRDFLKDNIPEGPFGDSGSALPPAIRAEYLARSTVGDLDYMTNVAAYGMEPWTISYEADLYGKAPNPKKANMYRPRLALPKGQLVKLRVVDEKQVTAEVGIGEYPTYFGISLSNWWLKLREYVLKREGMAANTDKLYDISEWYDAQARTAGYKESEASKATYYYPKLMGLYAVRAALYCDFEAFPSFKYAEAACQQAREVLGVSPIIVKWRPNNGYPSIENSERKISECAVDLSNELGLTFDGLNDWLRRVPQCVNYQE